MFCRTPWRYFAKLDVSSCGRWVLGKYPAKNRDSSTAVFQHAEWGAWLVLHCAKPPAPFCLWVIFPTRERLEVESRNDEKTI
uniref:Uncharacterized protein n=1 Tax=Ralstonia solanacearum TaxID=305 RepID=A0A0S4TY34_RALSL|nr:protein of unknown function [Ralstonia solanacearum]